MDSSYTPTSADLDVEREVSKFKKNYQFFSYFQFKF